MKITRRNFLRFLPAASAGLAFAGTKTAVLEAGATMTRFAKPHVLSMRINLAPSALSGVGYSILRFLGLESEKSLSSTLSMKPRRSNLRFLNDLVEAMQKFLQKRKELGENGTVAKLLSPTIDETGEEELENNDGHDVLAPKASNPPASNPEARKASFVFNLGIL